MIIPDVNLLIYAVIKGVPVHDKARLWLLRLMDGPEPVGFGTLILFGFIRVATNPRMIQPPMAVDRALELVDGWLARPHVRLIHPGPEHLPIAFQLLRDAGTAGNLTSDAQIAALAIEYQAEVHSNNPDFARFSGLRWRNPLVP